MGHPVVLVSVWREPERGERRVICHYTSTYHSQHSQYLEGERETEKECVCKRERERERERGIINCN